MASFTGYKKQYLKKDIIAALIVTAIAIPESLGFAALIGLPLDTGLYTAMLAPIVFALFANTKRLIVGADSATASLVAAGAVAVAAVGTAQYVGAVLVLGLMVGFLLILMALLKLGFLANLVSRPVLIGFFAGVGVQLMLINIPKLLGVPFEGSAIDAVAHMYQNFEFVNWMTVTVSILTLGVIALSRRTKYPGALIALVLATLFAVAFSVDTFGVKLVGALPAGLPTIALPSDVSLEMLVALLPAALSIALVIIAQSTAVIRSTSNEHDEKIHFNHDIYSLGFANITSSLSGGFAVNGSPPRSVAADIAGGRSQLVNIFMSLFIALIVIFATGVFAYMPVAALSAVVFMVGLHLIRARELQYLWQSHRMEFYIAIISLVGVVIFGVMQGVLIAVVASLMERLSRQYHPNDEVLLRDGELSEWAVQRIGNHVHHNPRPDGVLIYSFDGSLFFEDVAYFVSRLKAAVNKAKQPVHYVIVDAGAMDSIDYTAVESLKQLYRHLSTDNIILGFAHVSPSLYGQFDQFGVIDLVGEDNIYPTLNSVIISRPDRKQTAARLIKSLHLESGSYVVIGGAVMEALKLRDTKDVDIVVSDDVYNHFRDELHWNEYVLDNGKKMLSHEGCNVMHSWMGVKLKRLLRDPMTIDGITYMNVPKLIDVKKHFGRKKDVTDIAMLHQYLKRSRT